MDRSVINRVVLGALAAMLLAAAGVFWFTGREAVEAGAPPPDLSDPDIGPPGGDPNALPSADALQVGQSYAIDGTRFRVASLTRARYAGVEGELPFTTWDRSESLFADLDSDGSADGLRFATIDYSDDTPVAYVGTYVELEQLAARNLRRFEGW